MITREEIEDKARSLITSVRESGNIDLPITILVHESVEGWANLSIPSEFGFLLNDGDAKDAIFGAVRSVAKKINADAVIFANDTWLAEITEEGTKHLNTPEWIELHNFGFEKLVQKGWVKRGEAYCVTAQNATDVLILWHSYQRTESGRIQFLDSKRTWFEQSQFKGRQKMFGDVNGENII